jgi:hypothetical protein
MPKKIAPEDNPPERLGKSIVDLTLADLGADDSAVVLEFDLAAAEQVSHGRDCFFRVFRARTDREDQVSERKLLARFENLFGFHDRINTG